MKPNRKSISNSIRFDVFKRDMFCCQYCGGKAPDVVLNVDHINPVALGGTNDLLNLVTSCFTCNSGKSDRRLDDESSVSKSRTQAEQMEERRQQVRLMADWQIELARMDPEMDAVNYMLGQYGRMINDNGKRAARKLIRKFGLSEVLGALAIAYDSYDVDEAWDKVGGICHNERIKKENPTLAEINTALYKLRKAANGPPWKMVGVRGELARLAAAGYDWKYYLNSATAHSMNIRGNLNWHELLDFLKDEM